MKPAVKTELEYEVYLRREVHQGLEQLDKGECSQLDAECIIAQERERLAKGKVKPE